MPLNKNYPYTLDPKGNKIPIQGKPDKMGNMSKKESYRESYNGDDVIRDTKKTKPNRYLSLSEQYKSDKQLMC